MKIQVKKITVWTTLNSSLTRWLNNCQYLRRIIIISNISLYYPLYNAIRRAELHPNYICVRSRLIKNCFGGNRKKKQIRWIWWSLHHIRFAFGQEKKIPVLWLTNLFLRRYSVSAFWQVFMPWCAPINFLCSSKGHGFKVLYYSLQKAILIDCNPIWTLILSSILFNLWELKTRSLQLFSSRSRRKWWC